MKLGGFLECFSKLEELKFQAICSLEREKMAFEDERSSLIQQLQFHQRHHEEKVLKLERENKKLKNHLKEQMELASNNSRIIEELEKRYSQENLKGHAAQVTGGPHFFATKLQSNHPIIAPKSRDLNVVPEAHISAKASNSVLKPKTQQLTGSSRNQNVISDNFSNLSWTTKDWISTRRTNSSTLDGSAGGSPGTNSAERNGSNKTGFNTTALDSCDFSGGAEATHAGKSASSYDGSQTSADSSKNSNSKVKKLKLKRPLKPKTKYTEIKPDSKVQLPRPPPGNHASATCRAGLTGAAATADKDVIIVAETQDAAGEEGTEVLPPLAAGFYNNAPPSLRRRLPVIPDSLAPETLEMNDAEEATTAALPDDAGDDPRDRTAPAGRGGSPPLPAPSPPPPLPAAAAAAARKRGRRPSSQSPEEEEEGGRRRRRFGLPSPPPSPPPRRPAVARRPSPPLPPPPAAPPPAPSPPPPSGSPPGGQRFDRRAPEEEEPADGGTQESSGLDRAGYEVMLEMEREEEEAAARCIRRQGRAGAAADGDAAGGGGARRGGEGEAAPGRRQRRTAPPPPPPRACRSGGGPARPGRITESSGGGGGGTTMAAAAAAAFAKGTGDCHHHTAGTKEEEAAAEEQEECEDSLFLDPVSQLEGALGRRRRRRRENEKSKKDGSGQTTLDSFLKPVHDRSSQSTTSKQLPKNVEQQQLQKRTDSNGMAISSQEEEFKLNNSASNHGNSIKGMEDTRKNNAGQKEKESSSKDYDFVQHDQSPPDAQRTVRAEDQSYKYKYEEVVRNRAERRQLNARACADCAPFLDAVVAAGAVADGAAFLQGCSRHRARFTQEQTPDGFWDLSFADSPSARKKTHTSCR